jgi:imidazole glycerol phosphate synthase subunit HisF
MEHFVEVFEKASADAALAASIFHFKEIAIPDLKQFCIDKIYLFVYDIHRPGNISCCHYS